MQAYICISCGSELLGTGDTIATTYPHCGSTNIVNKNIEDVLKPMGLIPLGGIQLRLSQTPDNT